MRLSSSPLAVLFGVWNSMGSRSSLSLLSYRSMSILSRYRTALTRIQHPLPPAVSAEQAGRDENNESLLEIENRRNDQRESVSSRTRREDGEDGEKDVRRHRRQRMITKTYQPIDEPGDEERQMHFEIPESPPNSRFLSMSLLGPPNSGKSTLLNAVIGEKVSIVSPKSQTTRTIISGILTEDNVQIVFHDTPGIFPEDASGYGRQLHVVAWNSALSDDFVFVIVDATKNLRSLRPFFVRLAREKRRVSVILNKIDKLQSRRELLPIINELKDESVVDEIFPISALYRDGIDMWKKRILEMAPSGPFLYPPDLNIASSPLLRASEIIREKIFLFTDQEVPYGVRNLIHGWTRFRNGDLRIDADILVESTNHKKIIVGKNASAIKNISTRARIDLEKAFGCRVHLFLFVKVTKTQPGVKRETSTDS